MIFGDGVQQKRMLSKIECGYLHLIILFKILLIVAERVNLAVNAVIAREAAAARLLLASQALAQCRRETNPYLPENRGILGPTRAQLYGPDPCQTQEKELAGATTEHQAAVALAQRSAAPTPQDTQSAPAPQLSDTFWMNNPNQDPSIPVSEDIPPDPSLANMWSPTSLLETMEMIAAEMEVQEEGSSSISENLDELELIFENGAVLLQWDCWKKPKRGRKPYNFQPNNAEWVGQWVP
nr:nonstructural protein 2 [Psittaciform chaphamaparvovirus 6]